MVKRFRMNKFHIQSLFIMHYIYYIDFSYHNNPDIILNIPFSYLFLERREEKYLERGASIQTIGLCYNSLSSMDRYCPTIFLCTYIVCIQLLTDRQTDIALSLLRPGTGYYIACTILSSSFAECKIYSVKLVIWLFSEKLAFSVVRFITIKDVIVYSF